MSTSVVKMFGPGMGAAKPQPFITSVDGVADDSVMDMLVRF